MKKLILLIVFILGVFELFSGTPLLSSNYSNQIVTSLSCDFRYTINDNNFIKLEGKVLPYKKVNDTTFYKVDSNNVIFKTINMGKTWVKMSVLPDYFKNNNAFLEIVDDNTLVVNVNGEKIIVHSKASGINKGDWLLVLGKRINNSVEAKVIKVVEQAPKEVNSESDTKEEPKTYEPEKPKPAKETKPTVTEKPKTSTPAPTPAPEPTPAPAPTPTPSNGIFVISKAQDATNVTISYSIYPAMAGKCKTMLKKDSTIIYSDYDWHPTITSTCINTIPKSSLSAGTWTGIAYWKFPYNDWSQYYETNFSINVTIP
jgi:hypothetical protein